MKDLKNLFLTCGIIAGFTCITAEKAAAQLLTNLHSFSALTGSTNTNGVVTFTNTEGANAFASLVLSTNTLYGTAPSGGAAGHGTVFKVNTDGTGFTNLHSFAGGTNEGLVPYSELVLSGNTLYGTTYGGGAGSVGTVFKVNTDGTGFATLHSFTSLNFQTGTNTDGANPYSGLALSGSALYGTTASGGASTFGTIFKVNTDGGGFTNLHNFISLANGIAPEASMIVSNNVLYGTTSGGGTSGSGVVFSMHTDGTSFLNLHSFTGGNDGSAPTSGLVLSGSTLYGTTPLGGGSNQGIVFAVNTDGSHYTNLHSFTGDTNGGLPYAALILSSNTLYGSASGGGSSSNGAIFEINTNGTGFQNLYSFSSLTNDTNGDGVLPLRGLVLFSNMVYGTASGGGATGNGTVFQLTLPAVQTVSHPAFFAGELSLPNGVFYLTFPNSQFFGFYNYTYFPYIYHYNMGFEYFMDANDGASGAYLYDFTSGHFWYTSPSYSFPFLYDFSLSAVIYYYPDTNNPGQYTQNPRKFYNFGTSNVFNQ